MAGQGRKLPATDDHHEEHQYHPQDAITPAVKATGITGFAGLFAASVQATLTKQNIGMMGTFTRFGSTISIMGGMGFSYEFFRKVAANLREKNDSYNEAIGGFVSGSILGLGRRTMPAILGYGAAVSVVMATFDMTGGSLFGFTKDNSIQDEYDRKQALRANKRRPIEETISELGEGRGIFGPGYAERRAERIKERYGIDVPAQ